MRHFKPRIFMSLLAVMLCVTAFSVPASAHADENAGETEITTPIPEPTVEVGEPFSQGSEFSTRDMLYDKDTHKQFITVEDRDGNIFYIIIDYDAPTNEPEEQYATYFLNPVDTSDLDALLEQEDPAACTCTEKCKVGAIHTDCPVCAVNMAGCAGKVTEPDPTPTPEATPEPEDQPKGGGNMTPVLLLLVLALAGGGAFYYFKVLKNKPKIKGNTALDEYDYGEDEDELEPDTEDEPEMPEDAGDGEGEDE